MDLLAEEWRRLLVMVVLLAASALFSGAETAFFSLTRSTIRHMREDGTLLSGIAVRLAAHPRRLLVSVLLGNLASATGFFSIGVDLSTRFAGAGRGVWAVGTGVGVFAVFIFFGEFLPKGLALNEARGIARFTSAPLLFIEYAILPARFVLDAVAGFATRVLVGKKGGRASLTTNELKAFVRLTGSRGSLDAEEAEMLEDVIELKEIRVREVLIPRVDMATSDLADGRAGVLETSRRHRVSKVVVVDGSPDEVKGYVAVKELLYHPERPFEQCVCEIPAVPETKSALSLLREFMKSKAPLALVVDEYGGTEGIVAPEDLLEEVVGDLGDEYDSRVLPYRPLGSGLAAVAGDMSLRDWEDETGEQLATPKVDTIGGWVVSELDRMPVEGDVIETAGHQLRVIRVKGGRILTLYARVRRGEP